MSQLEMNNYDNKINKDAFDRIIEFDQQKINPVGTRVDTVRIIPDLHNFNMPNDKLYALKRINTETKADEAKCESDFLGALARAGINHPHIAQHYAGFTHGTEYFLLSDLAILPETNLEEFMNRHPRGTGHEIKSDDLTWLFKQMSGLADAVRIVHGPFQHFTGFHHDIKPENILIFDSESHLELRLTDWGRAKANVGDNPVTPSSRQGSTQYMAPEHLGHKTKKTGPTYDIWSLACVFLDMLIWFTEGKSKLDEFRDHREKTHKLRFFKEEGNNACLCCKAEEKLQNLRTARRTEGWEAAINLLEKMFTIDETTRPNAAAVHSALEEARNKDL